MKLNSLLFTFVFSSLGSFAMANLSCKDVFQNETPFSSALSAEFIEFKNEILNLEDLSLFWSQEKPKWPQYNQLKNLVNKANQIQLQNGSKHFTKEQKRALKVELQPWALPLHQKAIDLKPSQELIRFIDSNYGYFKLYEKINMAVGMNLFPVRFLDLVTPTKELVKEAKKTIKSNEKMLTDLFETTGHKSKAKYIKYTESFSPRAQSILNLVQNNLVVAIHRPEAARFWIPLAGFQNQRTTGSSGGAMDPNYRNEVESDLTFQNRKKYAEKSVRYMPNYGEARPDQNTHDFRPNTGADNYGTDLWIVKSELYKERATWTPRDSFGQPRAQNGTKAKSWDQMFIPWKDRELMVPFAENPVSSYYYTRIESDDFSPRQVSEEFKLEGLRRFARSYFEVQIWGPLTLDDIQAFHFKKNPPDKEFYHYLVSKNIEVWDERTWPAKKYNGDESK